MPGKPSEFFVGVVDLFAVLLPGAVLTALVWDTAYRALVGDLIPEPNSTTALWLAFSIASYFLGHMLFLAGSFLDPYYDWAREQLRAKKDDMALEAATTMREDALGAHEGAVNTYKWAKAVLRMKAPGCIAEIDRMEADSKFFRSLVVLLAVVTIWLFATGKCSAALIALALLGLSLWRYGDRRFKATELAYQNVVTLLKLPVAAAQGATG